MWSFGVLFRNSTLFSFVIPLPPSTTSISKAKIVSFEIASNPDKAPLIDQLSSGGTL
jgi:hypothetical protein